MAYEFRPDDCVILVLYAVKRLEQEPTAGTPSFVFGEVADGDDTFSPDRAPYVTEGTRKEVEASVMRALGESGRAEAATQRYRDLEAWLDERPEKFFLYQLEPQAIAGNGTARALGLEAEKKKTS